MYVSTDSNYRHRKPFIKFLIFSAGVLVFTVIFLLALGFKSDDRVKVQAGAESFWPRRRLLVQEVGQSRGWQDCTSNITENTVECREFHSYPNMSHDDKCLHVTNTADCRLDAGFINYLTTVYCEWKENLMPLIMLLMFILMTVCFIALGSVTDDFFCPCLTVISDTLKLSHNVAGVTFLAFGNGAADVFAAIAATQTSSGDPSMAVGSLFGANIYVTCVIVGSISIVKPFTMVQRPFLRDIIFYLLAVYWTFTILYFGYIDTAQSIAFVCFYIVYVIFVIISRSVRNYTIKKKAEEAQGGGVQKLLLHGLEMLAGETVDHEDEPFWVYQHRIHHETKRRAHEYHPPEPHHHHHHQHHYHHMELGIENKAYTQLSDENDNVRSRSGSIKKEGQDNPAFQSQNLLNVPSQSSNVSPGESIEDLAILVPLARSRGASASHIQVEEVLKNPALQRLKAEEIGRRPRAVSDVSRLRQEAASIPSSRRGSILAEPRPHHAVEGFALISQAVGVISSLASSEDNTLIKARADSAASSPHDGAELTWPGHKSGSLCVSRERTPTATIYSEDSIDPAQEYLKKGMWHDLKTFLTPIDLEQFKTDPWYNKLFNIYRAPISFILILTCPSVDYNDEIKHKWCKWLNVWHCLAAPQFICLAMKLESEPIAGDSFVLWMLVLILSIPVACFVAFTTRWDKTPKYHWLFAYFGFAVAIVWIYALANEAVNILQTYGYVLNLSRSILGLTLLAWGNSVADFVANMVMTRQGFPRMAVAACFGGPLFNVLLGLGLPFIFDTIAQDGHLCIKYQAMNMLTLGAVTTSVFSSFIFIPLYKFRFRPFYGIYLVALYLGFILLAVLAEVEVILT